MRDPELKEAESWAGANDGLMTDAEREIVRTSRAEAWSKRRIKRYVVAWSLIVLGLVVVLAIVEHFRRNAESERAKAESARMHAEIAERKEQRQRERADRLALEAKNRFNELTIDRGISLCQEGRTDEGLLWLMHGLKRANETDSGDPVLDRLARLELAAWRAELTSLRWFQESSNPVQAVAFSPDGRTALTSTDQTSRLWDVASGQPKGPTLNHFGAVSPVAFSPDGRTALTGSDDRTARLWDVETQKAIGLPLDHQGGVTHVSFSPEGTMVLTSSSDGTAQLWLAKTQRPIGAPFSHGGAVRAGVFSPDGRWIATACNRTAQLWRIPTPVEGSLDRLELWIRVVTMKEMNEFGAIRPLNLDTWEKLRCELDCLGGPPGQPGASGTSTSPPR